MKRNQLVFVSYFNRFYLRKGLLLYLSLRRWVESGDEFIFFCYDKRSFEILTTLKLPHLTPIPIQDAQNWSGMSPDSFRDRSTVEFMFTMTPFVLRYTRHIRPLKRMIYVDSDYYFYSSPNEIVGRTEICDLSFVEHGFPEKYQYLDAHGKYNVGWNSFAPTRAATEAINSWCLRTAEWCYDKIEMDKYADQKYLDNLAQRCHFLPVKTETMGLAEYNFFQYDIQYTNSNNINRPPQITSNGKTIISWHHHGVVENEDGTFSIRINIKEAQQSDLYKNIYSFYTGKLREIARRLQQINLCPGYGNSRRG